MRHNGHGRSDQALHNKSVCTPLWDYIYIIHFDSWLIKFCFIFVNYICLWNSGQSCSMVKNIIQDIRAAGGNFYKGQSLAASCTCSINREGDASTDWTINILVSTNILRSYFKYLKCEPPLLLYKILSCLLWDIMGMVDQIRLYITSWSVHRSEITYIFYIMLQADIADTQAVVMSIYNLVQFACRFDCDAFWPKQLRFLPVTQHDSIHSQCAL